jgi:hypothetical protein
MDGQAQAGWRLWATVGVADVARAADAYAALGFLPAWRGTVPETAARRWGWPASAGRAAALLMPPGQGGGVRLVETSSPPAPPLASRGWAAMELASNDLEAMALRVSGNGFRLVHGPAPLGSNPAIRALQAAGPAGEAIYVADLSHYAGVFDLIRPSRVLDGMFIAVLAAADLPAARAFHVSALGAETRSDSRIPVPALNLARGLPAGTCHRISTSQLPGGVAIEVDEAGPDLPDRATTAGEAPSGIALVTLARGVPRFDAPARCLTGAAGEAIEIADAA